MQKDCWNNGAFDTSLGHAPHGKRAAAEEQTIACIVRAAQEFLQMDFLA